jgi:hypothetical protein
VLSMAALELRYPLLLTVRSEAHNPSLNHKSSEPIGGLLTSTVVKFEMGTVFHMRACKYASFSHRRHGLHRYSSS